MRSQSLSLRDYLWHPVRKIRVGFVLILLLFFAMSGLSLYSLITIERTQDDLISFHTEALMKVESLELLSERRSSAVRTYLFTGESQYLGRIAELRSAFLHELNELQQYIETTEGDEFFSELKAMEERHFRASNGLIDRKRQGVSGTEIVLEFESKLRPLRAALDGSIAALMRHKELRFAQAKDRSVESISQSMRLILMVTILSTVIAVALSVLVWRTLSRLRKTEQELRDALQSRDEFLSMASHELKNPLAALALQLQMMRRIIQQIPEKAENPSLDTPPAGQVTWPNCERVNQLSLMAETQIKRLSSLLDELLDLTRIRVGRFELHHERVNLVALAEDVMARMRSEADTKGIDIRFERPGSLIEGYWDPLRLEQVLINLISNAIKYGRGTPVTIQVKGPDSGESTTVISVTDEGMGIPLDLQQKIFERFERASSGSQIKGLGLGLYIVRQIVEAHRGRVWVQSRSGAGSTFFVELPLSGPGSEKNSRGADAS